MTPRTVEDMRRTLLSLTLTSLLVLGLAACGTAPTGEREPVTSPEATTAPSNPVAGGGFTDGDCTGVDVTIDQDDTNAVLAGECGAITISSTGVFVTIENAESVTVTGSKIDVVVTGAVGTVSLGGEQVSYNGGDVTSLEIPGSSVNVTVNDAGSVSASGSNNFVVWSSGAASASDSGTGNTLIAP